jgi:hypothetical protein
MAYPVFLGQGPFIGLTQIYDLEVGAANADDFNARLRQNLNNMAINLNTKVAGFYSQEEYINGKVFYPDYPTADSSAGTSAEFRQVYSLTVPVGPLPGGGPYPQTKSVPHNIVGYPTAGTTTFIFVTINGCATDPATRKGIPLPYSSPTLADNIAIEVNGSNIDIIVGADYTAFTEAFVYLEYIKG